MDFDFTTFPVLETDRLTLRAINLEDAKAVFGLRANKEVNKYIQRESLKNLSEARAFIDQATNLVADNKGIFWVIESKNSAELLGTIGLRNFDVAENYAEIGYEIHPDYQERGYMTEAFEEVLEYAFEKMELKTIEAFTHKNNLASITLLHKLDFDLQTDRTDEGFEDNRIYKLEK
ncbi:GNAT family N-acetyltransferase [Polaribacter sp. R2A056_3_33]|jgi:ribosomal-protein-alanine N-acetyltransferase|uniref:GNAT family N-acetyltransferase n=1 Tax=unclassified Polaribacter TaxID=196858 RepID=UPI001C4F9E2D|nr:MULTISPECIES: GNAT family N-acetyltransferase [unclassified Polaribacter]QXP62623.1 GNAT family N-acetyltransferase [Polaribacter sp. HaHaR_3_91]QXP70547.1 GNAT family N-acetyltransferase [Polaribacter sp. R2A056_3_33]